VLSEVLYPTEIEIFGRSCNWMVDDVYLL
jgi:hypothetical protein